MILLRKVLNRVGDSTDPCRTPTVVFNLCPIQPVTTTALVTLSLRLTWRKHTLFCTEY